MEANKRRKLTRVTHEDTADPELWARGWRLDETEDSQVLVAPEEETAAAEEDEPGGQNEAGEQEANQSPETN